jgi:hypothetical protein
VEHYNFHLSDFNNLVRLRMTFSRMDCSWIEIATFDYFHGFHSFAATLSALELPILGQWEPKYSLWPGEEDKELCLPSLTISSSPEKGSKSLPSCTQTTP